MNALTAPTLTLGQLREDLKALDACTAYYPTNIISLAVVCGEVLAEFDTSEEDQLREELKIASAEVESANAEATAADERASTAEEKSEALLQEMDALKDPSANGESVHSYRQRAIHAAEMQDQYLQRMREMRRALEEAQTETKALRTRKGVPAGVFKQVHRIFTLLNYVSRSAIHKQHAEEAAAILKDINS